MAPAANDRNRLAASCRANHYDAIRNRDRAALLNTLDDDIELMFHGPPTIPFAGVWHGIEGAKRFYSAIRETAEVISYREFSDTAAISATYGGD
jgi:hypothetical protein